MATQSGDLIKSNGNLPEPLALHKLNDHCLLNIFKYLSGEEDAKNLGNTSKRLKNLYLYRYHKFTFAFHSDMFSKTTKSGTKVLDVILSEYDVHIRCWSLIILNSERNDAIEVVCRVSQYSTNLKRLEFRGIVNMDFVNCPEVVQCLPTVETLIFFYNQQMNYGNFLQHFRSLKQVRFVGTGPTDYDLQILFRNNRDIQSYYCNEDESFIRIRLLVEPFVNNFNSCDVGSKFNELCLSNDADIYESYDPMKKTYFTMTNKLMRLATTNLTKLKLDLPTIDTVDNLVIALAEQGTLKELELLQVKLGRNGFITVVQSFQSLQLLVLCPELDYFIQTVATTGWNIWPIHLTKFKANIPLDCRSISSIVNNLEHLTHLHFVYLEHHQLVNVVQILRDSLHDNHGHRILKLMVGERLTVSLFTLS